MSTFNPKVIKVLMYLEKGLKVEEIAPKVGYSHPRSLSRFMSQQGFRWDTQLGKYMINEAVKPPQLELSFDSQDQQGNQEDATDREDQDVQENPEEHPIVQIENTYDVLFEKFLDLVKEFENKSGDSNKHERDLFNFWKKAQKYRKSSTYSIIKSFRITKDIEGKLAKFSEQTHLSQKQIICMALDDFMEHYENEAI